VKAWRTDHAVNGRSVLPGLGWTGAAALVNLFAQFLFTAVLARTLGPAAFGLMAMAALSLRFASYFAQWGAGLTIIQSLELTPRIATAALSIAVAGSLVMYAVLVAAAPVFAAVFREPELEWIVAVYGLSLPLSAVGTLPLALLRRAGRFGRASLIELAGYLFGYGITGVWLALSGHGVWSLIWASLAQQSLVLLAGFASVRFPIAWPGRGPEWRAVSRLGFRYSTIGFLEFLWSSVEVMVAGRVWGQATLGALNRAQMICGLPVEQAVNVITKVLLPTMASVQGDRRRIGEYFLMLLLASGTISVAFGVGVAAAAPDVVAALLGPGWGAAVGLVVLFGLAVPASFVYVACGISLDSVAALRPKLRMQAALLLVKAVLVSVVAVVAGLHAAVGAAVSCEVLRAGWGLRIAARVLGVDRRRIRWVLAFLVILGLAVGSAVTIVAHASVIGGVPVMLRMLAEIAAAIGAAILVAATTLRRLGSYASLPGLDVAMRRAVSSFTWMHRSSRT
jgi:O-antigen/teichoic acid export membrane protein